MPLQEVKSLAWLTFAQQLESLGAWGEVGRCGWVAGRGIAVASGHEKQEERSGGEGKGSAAEGESNSHAGIIARWSRPNRVLECPA